MNYKERLNQSTTELELKVLDYKVAQSKLQLESDILSTTQAVSESKAKLEQLKNSYPLQTRKILEAEVELQSYENGLKSLEALKKELFD